MNRAESIIDLKEEEFDILIIGGGATGLGAAVDAASRGYKVGLLEGTILRREPHQKVPNWPTAACAIYKTATSA